MMIDSREKNRNEVETSFEQKIFVPREKERGEREREIRWCVFQAQTEWRRSKLRKVYYRPINSAASK